MNKKNKIFFLIPVLKGGGAERNIINLINNLDGSIYELTVVAGNIGGNLESELNKDIRAINLRCSSLLKLLFRLIKILKSEKPDILVSALPHINTISMMVKYFSLVPTKTILTEHTTVSSLSFTARTPLKRLAAKFILPIFMRFFYPLANAIVCVSQGVKEDLSLIVGELPQMKIIYNPVFDLSISGLSKEPLDEGREIFNQKKPVIIAVGRLVKAKDYPTLLKAFKQTLDSVIAHLLILGEGPEESRLKKLVAEMKMKNSVSFLGFKSNPYKYMVRSSVFALSSVREGFGNVIVEAMACGVPVVAADCKSGPGEIIQHGVNGILVEPQNPEALSGEIIRILNDSVLAKKLSANGLERARYFSIEKSVKEYNKVFQELL